MAETGFILTDISTLIIAVIVGATALVFIYINNSLQSAKEENDVKNNTNEPPRKKKSASNGNTAASKPSKKKQADKWHPDASKRAFTHSWLLTSLKGHSGLVLDMDFSSNGKFLATCGEDRAVILWSSKDWDSKDHKSLRVNIQFDHATHIKWSPDSKAFVIQKANEGVCEVYKVSKRPDGWISGVTKSATFPRHHQDDSIVGLDIACNGKFIMSCSEKNDLVISNLKGQQLVKFDTLLVSTYRARISPCGRFVVASGFAPDVRVWEVNFNKSGDFQNITKAFELTGHSAGVHDMGFSSDSSQMATVSKDGTWRVFNTKIDYRHGEDPPLLICQMFRQSDTSQVSHIAMSPNGQVIAVAHGSDLAFFSALSGDFDQVIEEVFNSPITCVQFDSLGKFVLVSGDKHVRVFHNVTGYRTAIASTKANFRQNMSAAQKERMEQQIKSAQDFLQTLGESF